MNLVREIGLEQSRDLGLLLLGRISRGPTGFELSWSMKKVRFRNFDGEMIREMRLMKDEVESKEGLRIAQPSSENTLGWMVGK